MKINCLSCGFKVDLDDTYEDFEGPIKCICGALLEVRIEEGMLKGIKLAPPLHARSQADGRRRHPLRSVPAGSGNGSFATQDYLGSAGIEPRFPLT